MVQLTPGELTAQDVRAIAREHESVSYTKASSTAIRRSFEYAKHISADRAVYGRSTGVGANRTVEVADAAGQLHRLIRSHSSSMGAARAPERVRAMVAVRLAQLAAGGSGISPRAAKALLAALNADRLPVVREAGSIGTGDLSALATIGSWMLDAADGPHLQAGDALSLISSNAGAIGDALLALDQLAALGEVTMEIAALTLRAVYGNDEAFDLAVEHTTPFPGARRVCQAMREHLAGQELWPTRIQDPYCLRAMPQVHGACLDAMRHATSVSETLAVAPSENPVLLPDVGVAHHAAFHAAYLAQALETALSAIAQSATQSLARVTMMSEPAFTGLPAFLADGTPGASGIMMVEYAAASQLAQLRSLATRSSIDSVSLSRGVEEDASFASLIAESMLRTVGPWQHLLGAELLCAIRSLTLQGAAVDEEFAGLTGSAEDRDLTADLDLAVQIVQERSGGAPLL